MPGRPDDPDDRDLHPVSHSREAFDLLAGQGQPALEESVRRMSRRAQEIVPELTAMSLSIMADDLTFTLVADDGEAGILDAIQYLDNGPCVAAAAQGRTWQAAPTDEREWHLFARAQAARGVATTLSLPVLKGGKVLGSVNLYASTSEAFDGHHDELAAACGAEARAAVTNADLSFVSRLRAAAAPARLRERGTVDHAVGYVASFKGIETEVAAAQIREVAARAGVTEVDVARLILDVQARSGD